VGSCQSGEVRTDQRVEKAQRCFILESATVVDEANLGKSTSGAIYKDRLTMLETVGVEAEVPDTAEDGGEDG
jgi:hypothetical protein